MKATGWIAFAAALAGFQVTVSRADVIYDVTFENPPHLVDSAPVTTLGDLYQSDRPYDQGGFVVSATVPAFPTQSAVISGSGYSFIDLHTGAAYGTSVHRISWDWAMLSLDATSDPLQSTFDILTSSGVNQALSVRYGLDQSIVVYDPISGYQNVGSFAVGQSFAFTAQLNMDTDTYDFFVNGDQVLASRPMEAGDALTSAAVLRPFGSAVIAVDNLRWDIIPEPSTLALLAMAGLGLALRVRRSPRAAH